MRNELKFTAAWYFYETLHIVQIIANVLGNICITPTYNFQENLDMNSKNRNGITQRGYGVTGKEKTNFPILVCFPLLW